MQKLMKRLHKNEKGFTLVELMVVVVIIGVLVAIAIPIFNNVQANAQKNACFANQRTIEGALNVYLADTGNYPSNTEATLNASHLLIGTYLQSAPTCPQSGGFYDITGGFVTGVAGDECSHGHYSNGTWQ